MHRIPPHLRNSFEKMYAADEQIIPDLFAHAGHPIKPIDIPDDVFKHPGVEAGK